MKYCIFVERIFDDKCFEALKGFCKKHPGKVKLFCLTPVNYELAVAEQGFNGTKEQLSKLMAERYKELESECNIDLHLHFGMRLENIDQERMMKEALDWMTERFKKPEYITYGWYIHNEESSRCENKFGLKFYNDHYNFSFHDYEYDKKFQWMMIITNLRGMLR